MNRRTFLKTGAVAPAFLRNLGSAAQERPNILLLMSDQHAATVWAATETA